MTVAEGRILVVDDDEVIRACVSELLRDEGYEVENASNGVQALALLAAEGAAPNLILLDMRMPVMDGWAFAREYRQRPGVHAPILVMTAAPDAAQRAAQIEAQAVLAKPFDIDHVLETVRRCVGAPPHH
jgi:two-component system chemotaxis response regulator CheY